MKLQRLILSGFGRFEGLTLELAPGFNVVYGPNEAGKSTLQGFLLGMLYGFKKHTQRRAYTPDLARFRPWAGGEYRGALEYELQQTGQQIRVERCFEPSQERVQIFDRVTGADLTEQFPLDRRKERLFAQEHLGLTEELFRSTAWIGQMQVSWLDAGSELVSRIANLQQAGQEDLSVQEALAWLDERTKTIGTERAAAKPLGRVVRRLNEVRGELQRAEESREQTQEWEAQLSETRGVLAEMAEEQQELERRLRWARWREAAAALKRAEDQHEQLRDEAAALQASVLEVEQEMRTCRPAAERGQAALAELDRLDREMAALREAGALGGAGAASGPGAEDTLSAPGRRTRAEAPAQTRLLQVAAVLLLAAAAACWVWLRSLPLAGALLAAALLLFTGTVGLSQQMAREARAAQEAERQAAEKAAQQARERQERLDGLAAEYSRILSTMGVGSAGEIRSLALRYEQLAARREGMLGRLQQIRTQLTALEETSPASSGQDGAPSAASQPGAAALAALRQDGATSAVLQQDGAASAAPQQGMPTLAALRQKVDALAAQLQGEEPRDRRSAAELQEAIRRMERRQAELNVRASDLAARVETVLGTAPDLADLRRELVHLEEERTGYEEELAALRLAREGIEAAAAEVHREFAPQLNAALGRTVAKLTGGRYQQIWLDEEMILRVETGDDRTVEADALSGGTVDQLFFSLRLALLDLFTQGQEPVPLLLDDPFVQFDDQRTREAVELLNDAAQERQVVLLTCRRREMDLVRQLGGHVIGLDVPAVAQ